MGFAASKIFHEVSRPFDIPRAIAWGLIALGSFFAVIFLSSYSFIALLIFIVTAVITIYLLERISYTLIISNGGSMKETSFLHAPRMLDVKDIKGIGSRVFSGMLYQYLFPQADFDRKYPLFLNDKFTDFPRFPVDPSIIEAIKDINSEIKNDYGQSKMPLPKISATIKTRVISFIIVLLALWFFNYFFHLR